MMFLRADSGRRSEIDQTDIEKELETEPADSFARSPTGSVDGFGTEDAEFRTPTDRLLLQLLDTSPGLLAYVSPDHIFDFANATFAKQFARHRDHFAGVHIREVIGQEAYGQIQPALDLTFQGQIQPVSMCFEAEGKLRWALEGSLTPYFDSRKNIDGAILHLNDVTSRIQAEQQLRDQDTQLRLALYVAQTGIYELDMRGGALQWDDRLRSMFGLSHQSTTSSLSDVESHIHPRDRGRVRMKLLRTVRRGLLHYEDDFRIVHAQSGEIRWLHATGRIVSEPGVRACRVVGVVNDVTDRRASDERARASRVKIQTLLNCIPQLIWTTTPQGQHIYANNQFLRFARTDENGRPRNWVESVHPEDAQMVIGRWNAAMTSGEIFEAEYRLRDTKGNYTWFLGRAVPVRTETGKISEWFGTATDINGKKLSEFRRNRIQNKVSQLQSISAALATAHKPYEVAQIVIEQGLLALEADSGCIMLVEPHSEALTLLYASGYNAIQLDLLKRLTIHSSVPLTEALRTREPVLLTTEEELAPFQRLASTMGFKPRAAIAVMPLLVQGQALGAMTLSFDTPQNFNDERIGYLTILAEQCAQATERARLFEAEKHARRNAEIASKAKSEFLANMSHEIRTPMNSILGFADLLGDKSLSANEREEYRNRIRMNGDQLMRLIDDILDLSKAETGKIQIETVSFSITELIRDIHESMSSVAKKKGLLTRITTDATVPHAIESDPVRLRQVLTNVIGNSMKFTDHGRIETRITMSGGQLVVEVEDTGIGISPELHQRLFQPFTQGDSSVTRRFGGSGLGLVVSRGVAEAMGGSLDLVRSESGHGSIFRLAVPIETKPIDPQIDLFSHVEEKLPSSPGSADVRTGPGLEGIQVLLVEDSFDNEMLIRAYLKGTGVQLEVARNGEEAVDRALDHEFDMVLMDIQMPIMDGLEATRRLRKKNYDRPIVALSAHALPEEVERSIAAGCHSHLTKPIPRSVLIEQIKSLAPRH